MPTLCAALRERLPDDVVVVAPDAGAVRRADRYARRLGAPVAVLHKRRESGTETAVTHVVSDTPLLAAALRRFLADGSIGDLF